MTKQLWPIKYRPKTLDDYIFQNEDQKQMIERFVSEQNIPHLLLCGHAGTGKTSLAYLIKNLLDIDDADFMVINASDDNSVDTIRGKIKGFISTYSQSVFKIVFLDEADYLTPNSQAALRSMMEDEYVDNARFILTCNQPYKLMDAIRSRCTQITYKKPDKEQMLARCAEILLEESVKFKLDVLSTHMGAYYPDFRKLLQSLQASVVDGVLKPVAEVSDTDEINFKIAELIESDNYTKIRDILSSEIGDDEWDSMYRFMYEFLHEMGKFKENPENWKAGIVIIAEHIYRHSFVADKEINAMAMFIKLGDL